MFDDRCPVLPLRSGRMVITSYRWSRYLSHNKSFKWTEIFSARELQVHRHMQHMGKNQESSSTIVSLGAVVYHACLNCTISLFDTRFPLPNYRVKLPALNQSKTLLTRCIILS